MKYGLRFDFKKMLVGALIEVTVLAFGLLIISYWLFG